MQGKYDIFPVNRIKKCTTGCKFIFVYRIGKDQTIHAIYVLIKYIFRYIIFLRTGNELHISL